MYMYTCQQYVDDADLCFCSLLKSRVIIFINIIEFELVVLHAKFQDYRSSGSGEEKIFKGCSGEEKIFKGFYYKRVWQPSWSCDLDYFHVYTILFPLPKEASHEIWHYLNKQFQRRHLKIMVIYTCI